MASEDIVSIEMALGAATLVLGVRVVALFRAERTLAAREARVRTAWLAGDQRATARALRLLAASVPWGDWTRDLRWALEEPTSSERSDALDRARRLVVRRVVRRAAQGQALDLVALSVALGLGAFARAALPTGPWFWTLGALSMLFLIAGVVLRGTLSHSVRSTLERLTTSFAEPPSHAVASEIPRVELSGPHVAE